MTSDSIYKFTTPAQLRATRSLKVKGMEVTEMAADFTPTAESEWKNAVAKASALGYPKGDFPTEITTCSRPPSRIYIKYRLLGYDQDRAVYRIFPNRGEFKNCTLTVELD